MCSLNSCLKKKSKKVLDPLLPKRPSVSCTVRPVIPNVSGLYLHLCCVARSCLASLEVNLLPLQISLILEASRSACVCPEELLDKQPGVPGSDIVNYTRESGVISLDMQKKRGGNVALKLCLSSCCLLSKVGLDMTDSSPLRP